MESGNTLQNIYLSLFLAAKLDLLVFADSVNQDQTAQNIQSNLENTMFHKEIFSLPQNTFEIEEFGFMLSAFNYLPHNLDF